MVGFAGTGSVVLGLKCFRPPMGLLKGCIGLCRLFM